ncbi:Oxidase fub9 [Xylographa trunciseda]|nr:Oxidase fub9 [Xylographa trunciseda]
MFRLQQYWDAVTSKEDVDNVIKHGVNGIVISNHAGRQVDTTPATIDILRGVVPFVKGKIHLALDGGVYRCSDNFKAIALGADFVFGRRIAIWGLAVRPFIISLFSMEKRYLLSISATVLEA